jgi:hypothetical protein
MKRDIVKVSIGLCGGIVFSIGAFTVFSYIIGKPWSTALTGVMPMASGTGIGFVFVGIAIILIGLRIPPQPI